ncbi:Phosphoribosylanthranilate isomerase [Chloroherpeton thalassium ATCC 35110]|uniref:N-(5'-phosphoribosyl)anthranilate isomerase n=1 Tax=Chloroherpeton thalassium (strain ATCC 35110 / GB-78) TaxID=517418 RepID=TRPF_CHLT3|nr:phosphoribosylanthranilate isomerase [Chloroherpeton thalassium]B3QS44.1 RecName: Full=N-(5'-phosphoribosyl)anthranilate isomerase; Short=PRAI [Chloroherpeton thalassium ATCC 35110]ACF13989.1 Phosphoribosylanthranilate isomerase [Chloroherpeton thalassium ATCC 35110]
MVKVKICGLITQEDAMLACQYGADLLGFNFYEKSPRYISPAKAAEIIKTLPSNVASVGVFVGKEANEINQICEEAMIDIAQIHDESLCAKDFTKLRPKIIKAFRVQNTFDTREIRRFYEQTGVNTFIFDAFQKDLYGGTGKRLDVELAHKVFKEIEGFGYGFLAGGLNEKNVETTVRLLKPYGVDVASGIESEPGKKAHDKMALFIREAKKSLCLEPGY